MQAIMNEQQPPKKLIISFELTNAIAQYLAQRPYAEVYQLIAALQQLQPAPEAPRASEIEAIKKHNRDTFEKAAEKIEIENEVRNSVVQAALSKK